MIGKNNPFNIRFDCHSLWVGLTGETKGFCNFSRIEYGIRAAALLIIVSYRSHGLKTYAELISRFAPPNENNTKAYIKFVTPEGKFPFDCPTTFNDFVNMLVKMSIMEGNELSPFLVSKVVSRYFLKYLYAELNER